MLRSAYCCAFRLIESARSAGKGAPSVFTCSVVLQTASRPSASTRSTTPVLSTTRALFGSPGTARVVKMHLVDEGRGECNQRPSEVIRGRRWSSVVKIHLVDEGRGECNQRPSVVISGPQWSSVVLTGTAIVGSEGRRSRLQSPCHVW